MTFIKNLDKHIIRLAAAACPGLVLAVTAILLLFSSISLPDTNSYFTYKAETDTITLSIEGECRESGSEAGIINEGGDDLR